MTVTVETEIDLRHRFGPARDQGRRPTNGKRELLQQDPHFRDVLLFPEFFNGDTGEGLGANHQTGWTGLIAKLLDQQAVHRKQAGL